MVSLFAFSGLVLLVAIERLLELGLSRRNQQIQLAAGGVEYGAGHYPVMVAVHVALLAACLSESWLLSRPFIPVLGYPMLGLLVLAALGRYWVISTLGYRWTTRIIVVPGLARIRSGPYRFLDHPNYLIVAVDVFALPLVHTNWITAILFTAANAAVLVVRIRVENRALDEAQTA